MYNIFYYKTLSDAQEGVNHALTRNTSESKQDAINSVNSWVNSGNGEVAEAVNNEENFRYCNSNSIIYQTPKKFELYKIQTAMSELTEYLANLGIELMCISASDRISVSFGGKNKKDVSISLFDNGSIKVSNKYPLSEDQIATCVKLFKKCVRYLDTVDVWLQRIWVRDLSSINIDYTRFDVDCDGVVVYFD